MARRLNRTTERHHVQQAARRQVRARLVPAHLVLCAIGTDTGGSVRIPASYNVVVGYKTSTGRIDKTGLVPLARTYETIGPLARSVEDCILLDVLMRGKVALPVRRAELNSLTVVAPTNVVLDDIELSGAHELRAVAGDARIAGVTVRRERVEALDRVIDMTARFGTLVAAEAYTEYRDIADSEKANELDRRVLLRMMGGRKMSAADVLSIQRGRQALIPTLTGQLDGALLAMPTTVLTAPKVAPLDADHELFHKINMRTLRNTTMGNVLDLCAVALPNSRDGKGLPTSILFSAPHNHDEQLLGYALAIGSVIREFFKAS